MSDDPVVREIARQQEEADRMRDDAEDREVWVRFASGAAADSYGGGTEAAFRGDILLKQYRQRFPRKTEPR